MHPSWPTTIFNCKNVHAINVYVYTYAHASTHTHVRAYTDSAILFLYSDDIVILKQIVISL